MGRVRRRGTQWFPSSCLRGKGSETGEPAGAYAAVRYQDSWYWIADKDFASKRVFTFLMLFFSLAETGVTPQPPLVTIPAN